MRWCTELRDKNCVVTGSTSGIGRRVACALADLNANIILTGRNERAGRDLLGRLKQRSSSSKIEFIPADQSRLGEVHTLAASISESFAYVAVLINNAGARFDSYGRLRLTRNWNRGQCYASKPFR